MSFIIRAARASDLQPLYEMAKLTGGGFTNLPPDRKSLTGKLDRAAAAFGRDSDEIGDDLFVFMLENGATGEIRGTCQIFSMLGVRWPFYSYRIGTLSQRSEELDRTFTVEMLSLTNDLEKCSEVGGLFLHPGERAGGLGMLLARSRYLFIRNHRSRFRDHMLAELRGVIDEAGGSPFWDGLAGKFFGMNFQDADQFNAVHGNQFIADLMPKHPVYVPMLPETARAVIGVPHPSGRAAMRMLENEGFRFDSYIDIFDGGPTMTALTDDIRSLKEAEDNRIIGLSDAIGDQKGGEKMLIAHGRLSNFRAGYGWIERQGDGILLDAPSAAALGVAEDDTVTHVARW